ncbi:hypothetical protein ABZ990_15905 [Streptomyces sp. NPDC046203]|uniref:hypothetical protein n=1 Tax=Streptomyces sp. NPDC046203 TaxID=3154602 RepID=UPI0033FA8A82
MTRTKRLLAGIALAVAVAAGTATPALADMHAMTDTPTGNIHATVVVVGGGQGV